nr:hypothetical protein [uncultured Roseateles sp.]
MRHRTPALVRPWLAAALITPMLFACGGSISEPEPPRAELMLSSDRGLQSIVFDGGRALLSQSNSDTQPSRVLRADAANLTPAAQWQPLAMGACALPANPSGEWLKAGKLQRAGGKTWLLQGPVQSDADHALCMLDTAGTAWLPQDAGLKVCNSGYCDTLWASELKAVGSRLFSNAGAGPNLLVSDDQGTHWRALLGQMDSMICTHQSFHIVGSRVLVGGECPLDIAYVRAYGLSADGGHLSSPNPLPMQLPELENRNVHFIESVPGTQRVFVGVEGGLLRSDDGGQTFKFVIRQPLSGGNGYPYITALLSPAGKPNRVIAAGFDKAAGKPYLTWSDDGGDRWTELSALLPGYAKPAGNESTTQVTSLTEDAQGRIWLTVNEDLGRKGRLLKLSLGAP